MSTATTPAPGAPPQGLVRPKNWATQALGPFLRDRAGAPFKWGVNDCATFAADAIQAVTGVDIAADFRGKYEDEAGALAAIQAVCGGSTVADAAAYCAQKHGLAEWPHPLRAQRGDLVVAENDGKPIAGIVHLSGNCIVTVGEGGLVRLPFTSIQRAWHVGPATTPAALVNWHTPPAWKAAPRTAPNAGPKALPMPAKTAPALPASGATHA